MSGKGGICLKTKFFTVLFPILLVIFFLPSINQAVAKEGEITVKLVNSRFLGNQSTFNIEIIGNYIDQTDNKKLSGNYTLKKSTDGNLLLYKNQELIKTYNGYFELSPEVYGEDNYIKLNNHSYLGDMLFKIEGTYIRPSNTLALDDYLKGVVPSEMYPNWPLEALKSQAIAARTYASSYIGKTTIDDTISYQVYGGYLWSNYSDNDKDNPYVNSNKAVESTTGEILTFNGRSLGGNALYYSSNGGLSLSNTNTWGNGLFPYYRTGRDPYDSASTSQDKSWSYDLLKTQINLNNYDVKNPDKWWSSVTEAQSAIMSKVKNWMYTKKVDGTNIINPDYEMKIVGISGVEFTNPINLSPTSVLNGKITIQYALKNKTTNTYRLNSSGNLAVYSYELFDRSYNIRSLVGISIMKSPYIKSVENKTDGFSVLGGGNGHGIGMSQYGASEMAKTQSYSNILSYYYPGTKITKVDSLIYVYPIEFKSLTANVPSPQKANSTITITAETEGGKNKLFAFHLYDGKEWVEVQPYSSSNTFNWTPSKPGNYKFSVHVKESTSTNPYDDYETVDYSITADDVKFSKITLDKQSPQKLGQMIQLTAEATGGINLLYAFHVYDGENWKEIQSYSSTNSLNWKPTKPGNYKFSVHVKDESSVQPYDDYGTAEYSILTEDISFSGITVDKQSPQYIGQDITLSAIAQGGYNLQYAYHLFDGNAWKEVRPYSSDNKFIWKPDKSGKYRFSVHVKSSDSTKKYDVYKVLDYEVKNIEPVKATALTVDKQSPQNLGTSLTLSAQATGGIQKQYKFHVFDGKEWSVLRDYDLSNKVQWSPTKAGEYKLVVHVKDQNSNKEYDSYTATLFTIKDIPVDIQGVETSLNSPQPTNTLINLIAKATGGTTKLYKFNAYDGNEWSVLKGYSSDPKLSWTPSKPGKYKFSVHVKDERSTASYDDYYAFEYEVVSGTVKVSSVDFPNTVQSVNNPISISAATTGGTTVLYKFWVEENGQWKVIQDYSSTSNVTWIPSKPGTYKFSVHVKDQNSTKAYDDYKGFTISVK